MNDTSKALDIPELDRHVLQVKTDHIKQLQVSHSVLRLDFLQKERELLSEIETAVQQRNVRLQFILETLGLSEGAKYKVDLDQMKVFPE